MQRDNSHSRSSGQTKRPAPCRSPSPDEARAFAGLVEALGHVRSRQIYIDTLRVLLQRQPTQQEHARLRRAAGRRVGNARRCGFPAATKWGWRWSWQFNGPSWELLGEFAALGLVHQISRLDIALDLEVPDEDRKAALRSLLKRHLVVRPQKTQRIIVIGRTLYFARVGSSRAITMYGDKPGKIRDSQKPLHVELRLKRSATMARENLRTVDRLNPEVLRRVFDRRVKLFAVTDGFGLRLEIEKAIRGEVDLALKNARAEWGFIADGRVNERDEIWRARLEMAAHLLNTRSAEIAWGARWERAPVTNLLARDSVRPLLRDILIAAKSISLTAPRACGARNDINKHITPTTTPQHTTTQLPTTTPTSAYPTRRSISRHSLHRPSPEPSNAGSR